MNQVMLKMAILCLAMGLIGVTRVLSAPESTGAKPIWVDLNQNGQLDLYEDPGQSAEKRAVDLLSRLTLEEKID